MKKLIQKRLFNYRHFELTDKVLRVKTKDLKEKAEFEINLEHVGNQLSYHSDNMIVKNVIMIIFALVPIGLVLGYFFSSDPPERGMVILNCALWIPLTLFIYFIRGKHDTHIVGGAQIVTFYQDKPTKEEVDIFAKEVIEKSTTLIRNKYMKVDSDLPEDTQMNTFNWLLSNEFISQEEYDGLKHAYKTNKLL